MYLLGLDIGSSSVKAAIINAENGKTMASAFYPETEMPINAPHPDWAEQEPEEWWENTKLAIKKAMQKGNVNSEFIKAIGLSYQMHGLVALDKESKVLRPSIIWCDSRAVSIGDRAFKEMGEERCLMQLFNSPGNFTASKLKWIKDHEPDKYKKIDKIMLPGDYIAMKLTGNAVTTAPGLSEGIFWDFQNDALSHMLMDYFQFDESIIPSVVPTFSNQGMISREVAEDIGLEPGTLVTYRAGDQPNNALSLNVLNPGEIAATGGTSGVVYGITDQVKYDQKSRVNTFLHVNHSQKEKRMGVLLCINGVGILNAWLKKLTSFSSYEKMNEEADKIPVGSEGLKIFPFGNGAERMLENKQVDAHFTNINFNIHHHAHLFRAAQEGIVFSFAYGLQIMKEMGLKPTLVKAGNANMFLSNIFRETMADLLEVPIELYDTDGAKGAALGAGHGAGIFKTLDEAFKNLKRIESMDPNPDRVNALSEAYAEWAEILEQKIGW